VAYNIVAKRTKNRHEEAHDLLSLSLEYALSQRERYIDKPDKEIGLMLRSIMSNKFRWTDSDFNKQKMLLSNNAIEANDRLRIADKTVSISLIIDSETMPSNFKQFIKDNMMNYTEDQVHKIVATKIAYLQLTKTEKILFDKYFVQNMTMRDVAQNTTLPLCSIFKNITSLKEKIRELCKLNYKS
jgi:hypothetical protein